MDPEADICQYCGQHIEERQARVRATCSRDECGQSLYHSWCVDSYTQKSLKSRQFKAGAQGKASIVAKVKPWKNLELCSRCPAGWYKQTQALKGMSEKELAAAQRLGQLKNMQPKCSGRVVNAELVEINAKQKKSKHRTIKQPPPHSSSSHQRPHPSSSSSKPSHPQKGAMSAAPVDATMSLARAKEFLGLSSDSEDEASTWTHGDGSDANNTPDRHEIRPGVGGIKSTLSRTSPSASLHSRPGTAGDSTITDLDIIDDDDDIGVSILADDVILTKGEVEIAVRDGLLPKNFRTKFCDSVKPGYPPCNLGLACPNAHSLEEFRTDAAIRIGTVKKDFKTLLCQKVVAGQHCPSGKIACHFAHSSKDIRAPAAIADKRVQPWYKTGICPAWGSTGLCRSGLLCPHAHGAEELRKEAAVFEGIANEDFKMDLCPFFFAGFCGSGPLCTSAHSVKELRLGSLRSMGALDPEYKSTLCPLWQQNGQCPHGIWCKNAHGEGELLSVVDPAATLCPIKEEVGSCFQDCLFAHSVKELTASEERMQMIRTFSEAFHQINEKLSRGGGSSSVSAALTSGNVRRAAQESDGNKGKGEGSATLPFNYNQYKEAAAAKSTVSGGTKSTQTSAKGSRGPPRLNFAGRRRPNELKLCGNWKEMGRCPVLNCEYAHGYEELREREAAWRDREQEEEQQRRQQEIEDRRAAQQAEEAKRRAEAELLQSYGFDIDVNASCGVGSGGGSRNPQVEQAWSSISQGALSLLRSHKENQCVLLLLEAGFNDEVARAAAIVTGADVNEAVALAVEVDGDSGRLSGRPPKEVDITQELDDLLEYAISHGLDPGEVDIELAIAAGDWERAKEELRMRQLANASYSETGEEVYMAEAHHQRRKSPRSSQNNRRSPRNNRGSAAQDISLADIPLPPHPNVGSSSAFAYPDMPPPLPSAEVSFVETATEIGGSEFGLPDSLEIENEEDSTLQESVGLSEMMPSFALCEQAVSPAKVPAAVSAAAQEEEDLAELLGLLGVG